MSDKFVCRADNKGLERRRYHSRASGMNIHVHASSYYDTGEANDVESGLAYWMDEFEYSSVYGVAYVVSRWLLAGLHEQFVDEAKERQQDVDKVRDRLVGVSAELSQSANHVAALEEAIEAERTSHIQTKFSCELFQV